MYQRILVPVDSSASTKATLAEVGRFTKMCPESVVRLVHVVDLAPATAGGGEYIQPSTVTKMEDEIKQAGLAVLETVSAAAKTEGFTPETVCIDIWGKAAAEAIVEAAKEWNADIIIMGTHGYSGLSHLLLGSVAEGVVRHAPVPVLLVRAR